MKIHTMFLGSALVAAVAIGGCDSSKADLEKTKADLATVTTERDALKAQLDSANTHEKEMTSQIADLNAKLAATQPAKPGGEGKRSRPGDPGKEGQCQGWQEHGASGVSQEGVSLRRAAVGVTQAGEAPAWTRHARSQAG